MSAAVLIVVLRMCTSDGAVDGGAAHALVVDRRAPDTDGEGTALAERALFADWLAGRRAAARITWYWGDRRQTDRLDDARR